MADDQSALDGRFQITPLVLDAEDRFHISFEIVVTSGQADIAALTVMSRLGTQLTSHAVPEPAAVVRTTLERVNRAMLPVTVLVTDAAGHTTGADDLPALLVPPGSDADGVPLPYSAATVDDFPFCQRAWSHHERARQQLHTVQSEQDYLVGRAAAVWRLGMTFATSAAALGFAVVLLQAVDSAQWIAGLVAVGAAVISAVAASRIWQSHGLRKQAISQAAGIEEARAALLAARKVTLERCPPSQWHKAGGCGCACKD